MAHASLKKKIACESEGRLELFAARDAPLASRIMYILRPAIDWRARCPGLPVILSVHCLGKSGVLRCHCPFIILSRHL